MRAWLTPTAVRAAPLAGSLGTVPLADVLQLLELGRKSGVLAVDAGDGRRGLIRLVAGGIAGARYQDARGTATHETSDVHDAVGALLDLACGRFAFTAAPARPGEAPRVRVEAVLMAAFHRADERARVEADVARPERALAIRDVPHRPELGARVPRLAASDVDALCTDACAGTIPLRATHWAALAAVDGVRDVDAIAADGHADPATVRRAFVDLAAVGLVTFGDRPGPAGGDVPRTAAHSSAF